MGPEDKAWYDIAREGSRHTLCTSTYQLHRYIFASFLFYFVWHDTGDFSLFRYFAFGVYNPRKILSFQKVTSIKIFVAFEIYKAFSHTSSCQGIRILRFAVAEFVICKVLFKRTYNFFKKGIYNIFRNNSWDLKAFSYEGKSIIWGTRHLNSPLISALIFSWELSH